MADGSKIEWTDATWSPVVGCTHVSAGCDNCYAARDASGRLKHLPLYAGLAEKGKFTGEVRLVPDRLALPIRWTKPRRIFVNSMSDLFHEGVPNEFIARVFAVMALAPRHSFQVLTKRHGRMRALLRNVAFRVMVDEAIQGVVAAYRPASVGYAAWPLPNVWLGVSVEDQKWADIRILALLETPAAVRFLSCEPLLGPVTLRDYVLDHICATCEAEHRDGRGLGWVIVGGESGPGARPMHPAWARQLRDECAAAGVPYLFKQHGEWTPDAPERGPVKHMVDPDGSHRPAGDALPAPGAVLMWRSGKKAAGRLLDGRTYDEYPEVDRAAVT